MRGPTDPPFLRLPLLVVVSGARRHERICNGVFLAALRTSSRSRSMVLGSARASFGLTTTGAGLLCRFRDRDDFFVDIVC